MNGNGIATVRDKSYSKMNGSYYTALYYQAVIEVLAFSDKKK